MPVTSDKSGDLRPTMVAKPDMRFATTFLSNKYRHYAVEGESLMDKATGEIYTKRLGDGRVVSFFQNKKYMSDLALDLRVLLSSFPNYVHPTDKDIDSFYLNTDYDVMAFNNDEEVDILKTNGQYGKTADPDLTFKFKVSTKSNGFFFKPVTRDVDKNVLDFIISAYNSLINYTGDNTQLLAAKKKLTENLNWADATGELQYKIDIEMKDKTTRSFTATSYFRYNNTSCVIFPDAVTQTIRENATSITVTFQEMNNTKFDILMKNINALPGFKENFDKFKYADGKILLHYINISQFVDSVSDITYIGKEFTIAMVDTPSAYGYMARMAALMKAPTIIVSPLRPDSITWGPNAIWAETVRVITANGEEYHTYGDDSEVDFHKLEQYLADNNKVVYLEYSEKSGDTEDIYVSGKTGGVL